MSAGADALKKLGMENTAAVETAETLVSGVASFLSIYSAIGAVAVQLLSLWDKQETSMQPIMHDLMKNCIALFTENMQEEFHAKDEVDRIRLIDEYVSSSRTAATIALKYLANPDTEKYDISDAYSRSLNSVYYLTSEGAFTRHYSPSLIFNMWLFNGVWDLGDHMDPGSNREFPPPDLKWEYRYVLPALLESIGAYLIVIKAMEPDTYLQKHQLDIRRCADYLLQIHNKILSGISIISPPPEEVRRGNFLGQIRHNFFYGWWGYKVGTQYVPLRIGEGDANILLRPYGAVETYSGLHSIGNYPHYKMSSDYDAFRDDSMQKFYTKFHVRALKHKMAVYNSVGLPAIWRAMVNLKTLIGDPIPELKENMLGWSIRTVTNSISPYGVYQSRNDKTISVAEIMHAIDAPDPIYCRDMLEYGASEEIGVEGGISI